MFITLLGNTPRPGKFPRIGGANLSIGFQMQSVITLKQRVLLVEDTPELSLWLGTALRQLGLTVDFAPDGEDAHQRLCPGHGYDLVLLDLNLPRRDGLSVLEALRQRSDPVPVLILTARASVADRVLGLNGGADDYLPKPFDLSEFEARVGALLRRPRHMQWSERGVGPLLWEAASHSFRLHGQVLSLSPREAAALQALVESAHRVVSKERLHASVFGEGTAELDAVEVLIYRLRKKVEIGPPPGGADSGKRLRINTLRGLGYMLTDQGKA
jgi:two-component system response regulator TctD